MFSLVTLTGSRCSPAPCVGFVFCYHESSYFLFASDNPVHTETIQHQNSIQFGLPQVRGCDMALDHLGTTFKLQALSRSFHWTWTEMPRDAPTWTFASTHPT